MKIFKMPKLLLAIIIIVLLELTLFNFRYYTTLFSGTDHEIIDVTEKNLTLTEYDGFVFEKTYYIELNKIVKGVKLNLSVDSEEKIIKVEPMFKDKNATYTEKNLDPIDYTPLFKNAEYIVLNSQEECLSLELTMSSKGNFKLNSIEINTWYFEFNVLRVCTLIFISALFLYRKDINKYFDNNPKEKNRFYIGIIIIGTLLMIIYSVGYGKSYEESSWDRGMILKDIYKLFTESLIQGKITIEFPEEYREELLKLKNYKDYSERIISGATYLYDGAFYEGNYYCYYGIVPVLTVLLPMALITGISCYSYVICIIYATLLSIVLLKIYQKLLEKFKFKTGFILEVCGFLALYLSMGIDILILQPNFYQAVDLCGIFWGLLGTLLILNMENGKKIKRKLFFTGLSFGFMVCTRPMYVFYIIPLLIGIYKYIFPDKKFNKKNAAVFAVPILIMAIFQMCYNYVRFDNILEFGQFHQITINDPSSQEIEIGMAMEGVFSYLFNPPRVYRNFPFVDTVESGVRNGNVIFSMTVLGVFWHPFLLIILTARKRTKNNKKLMLLTISIWIITIILLALNACLAGMNQRYLSDVLPTLALLALTYWLIYITEKQNEEVRRERLNIYKLFCCISVIVMLIFSFYRTDGGILYKKNIDRRVIEYEIKHSLEFYKNQKSTININ